MEQKKNIIVDYGWYSHHLLIEYHRGNIYFDKKIIEADIIDGIIKEWWIDNIIHYSFYTLEALKTFRSYITTSKCAFYLLNKRPKDKTIIVFTKDDMWWELNLKDKEFYSKRIKTDSNEFELIFQVLYSSRYKKWIKFNLSETDSATKKMKIIAEYVRQ